MSNSKKRASIIVFKTLFILCLILGVGKVAHAYVLGSQPDDSVDEALGPPTYTTGNNTYLWSPTEDIDNTATTTLYFSAPWKGTEEFGVCNQFSIAKEGFGNIGYFTDIADTSGCLSTKNTVYRTFIIPPTGSVVFASTSQYYIKATSASTAGHGHAYTDSAGALSYMIATDPSDLPSDLCVSAPSRICSFSPADNVTLTGPTISFSLSAFIDSTDTDGFAEHVQVSLYNIDQNVLLIGAHVGKNLYDDYPANGHFDFATSTVLADGNYRLEACIYFKSPLNLLGVGDKCTSHQFIVGAGTFIGNISQTGFSELNTLFGSTTATTTNSAGNCIPGAQFSIGKCGGYLFIPDAYYLGQTFSGFHDAVLTHIPWGYFTRVVDIMSDSSTTVSLPVMTINVQLGPNSGATTSPTTFDPGDMITGGGALLASVRDPIHGKSARDVLEPFVQILFAIAVLYTIISDLTGSHNHAHNEPREQTGKRT